MTDKELLQQLFELIESAIKAGDWKVDGACDPDFLLSLVRARLKYPDIREIVWMEDEKGNRYKIPEENRSYILKALMGNHY